MLVIKHTIETVATPEAVWKIWEDVENWNSWDPGIEMSSLKGPFKAGTKGILKPRGGPLVYMTLTLVTPYQIFVDEAKLRGARIVVTHTMERKDNKTVVTHHIEMKGPLAFFYAFVIGRTMKRNLPHEMAAMVKKAEGL